MIALLDTHALLWSLENSRKLSTVARKVIEDGSHVILASAASGWEIAIKSGLGRLATPGNLEAAIESAGFTRRTITFADVRRIQALPRHHRDPFDRMLVAQALEDGVPIITRDDQIRRYPVQVIW